MSQASPAAAIDHATQDHRKRYLTGLALAAIGAICFSGKAIIVKLAYRYQVDAVTLLMLRMAFALPVFVVMAWWGSRGRPTLARRDWLGVLGLGFSGYYLASFLDFWGLQYVSASLERLVLYLNPTLVVLLAWALYGRRINRGQALAMAVSYSGVLLVFGHELLAGTGLAGQGGPAGAGLLLLGLLLVFGSAVSYAVYLSYSGELVQRLGSLRLVGLATTVACLLCIAQFALLRPFAGPAGLAQLAPQVIWLSLLNASMCTAVPVLLLMMAIERLGAGTAAQVGMVGPLSTIAMGALILGEPFTVWVAAGTVLVIAGIYGFTRKGRVAAVD
jgi:drug/metabolite transporter (DMT)-like permease